MKFALALLCSTVLASAADAGPVLDRIRANRDARVQVRSQAKASGNGVWLAVRIGWPLQLRVLVLPEARRR